MLDFMILRTAIALERHLSQNKYAHPQYDLSKKSNDLLLILFNRITSVEYATMDDGSYCSKPTSYVPVIRSKP